VDFGSIKAVSFAYSQTAGNYGVKPLRWGEQYLNPGILEARVQKTPFSICVGQGSRSPLELSDAIVVRFVLIKIS
jgi:hypothetical protein